MIATVVIELSLAAWIVTRYATSSLHRLAITMLICLGGFQFAEFNVCGEHGPTLLWSRLGYILITLLPPLGLHIITLIRRQPTKLIAAAYTAAGVFIAGLAFVPSTLNASVCTGNYVIFQLAHPFDRWYAYYYVGLLLFSLALAIAGTFTATNRRRRASLGWMASGYLAFMVPSYAIYFLFPTTGRGLPSIMCGFAVTFALILGLRVVPNATSPLSR
ncbi:MAG TPA: hypothetical protein VMT30_00380 [Candidatus Saccharimonadia bacterium]|nr:hypothetical protein [Candidatus Saccharimonadia bacterium]